MQSDNLVSEYFLSHLLVRLLRLYTNKVNLQSGFMHVAGSMRELLSDGVGDSGLGWARLSFIAEQGRSGRGGIRAAVRRPNEASFRKAKAADEAMITTKKRRRRMKKKFPPHSVITLQWFDRFITPVLTSVHPYGSLFLLMVVFSPRYFQ